MREIKIIQNSTHSRTKIFYKYHLKLFILSTFPCFSFLVLEKSLERTVYIWLLISIKSLIPWNRISTFLKVTSPKFPFQQTLFECLILVGTGGKHSINICNCLHNVYNKKDKEANNILYAGKCFRSGRIHSKDVIQGMWYLSCLAL